MDIDDDNDISISPEMEHEHRLHLLDQLLRSKPPHRFSRADICEARTTIKTLQDKIAEAAETMLSDEEVLGLQLNLIDLHEEKVSASLKGEMSSNEASTSSCGKITPNEEDDDIQIIESDEEEETEEDEKERHVSFQNFITNDRTFLKMTTTTAFCETNTSAITYPLGVVYDEITRDWFICERKNMIIRIGTKKRNEEAKIIEHKLLTFPSALTIYKEGKSLAVLCSKAIESTSNWILIYKYGSKPGKGTMWEYCSYSNTDFELDFPCRGLARTVSDNLMTVDRPPPPSSPRLRILSQMHGQVAYQLPLAHRPSFISSNADRVAISDLGTQIVFLLKVDDSNWDILKTDMSRCVSVLSIIDPKKCAVPRTPRNLADTNQFCFVAGLQFDRNGYLLIGDARGQTIKLFDPNLEFMHRISTNFTIPFMSSFCVNRKGQVLLIDLHGQKKFVFARLKSSAKCTPWIDAMTIRRNLNAESGGLITERPLG